MNNPKMTFRVEAQRIDAHGSLVRCKNAEVALDTDLAGGRRGIDLSGSRGFHLCRVALQYAAEDSTWKRSLEGTATQEITPELKL